MNRYPVLTERRGLLARIGRGMARVGGGLGYDTDTDGIPGGRTVATRGYYRDSPISYTQAPLSSRKIWELYKVRQESRNLSLQSPILSAFIRWADTNTIGAENSRLEFAGLSVQERERLAEVFEFLRREWAAYQQMEIGSGGETLRDLARKLLRDALVDGDCFVIPYVEGGTRKYQPFPGDSLAEQFHGPLQDGRQRELGVEIDSKGQVRAYHFGWNANFRPLSALSQNAELDAIRVEAARVWHLRPLSEGTQDLRSMPWCTGVLDDLARSDQFYSAFVRAAINRSSVGIALERDGEQTAYDDTRVNEPSIAEVAAAQDYSRTGESGDEGEGSDPRDVLPYQEARSRAGHNLILEPGYKPTMLNTGSPSPQEAMVLKTIELRICSGLRVSPMTLLGDYSGVSYSAGQMAVIQERNTLAMLQSFMTRQFYSRVYSCWFRDVWPEAIKAFPGVILPADMARLGAPAIRLKMYETLEKAKQAQGFTTLFAAGLITAAELRDHLGFATADMDGIMEQALSDRDRLGVPAAAPPPVDNADEDEDDPAMKDKQDEAG